MHNNDNTRNRQIWQGTLGIPSVAGSHFQPDNVQQGELERLDHSQQTPAERRGIPTGIIRNIIRTHIHTHTKYFSPWYAFLYNLIVSVIAIIVTVLCRGFHYTRRVVRLLSLLSGANFIHQLLYCRTMTFNWQIICNLSRSKNVRKPYWLFQYEAFRHRGAM